MLSSVSQVKRQDSSRLYRILKNRLKISPELVDGGRALEQPPSLSIHPIHLNLPPLPLSLHQGYQLRVALFPSTILRWSFFDQNPAIWDLRSKNWFSAHLAASSKLLPCRASFLQLPSSSSKILDFGLWPLTPESQIPPSLKSSLFLSETHSSNTSDTGLFRSSTNLTRIPI